MDKQQVIDLIKSRIQWLEMRYNQAKTDEQRESIAKRIETWEEILQKIILIEFVHA